MSDRGLYLLILKLKRGQNIKAGRFRVTYFRPGYYLYVGRARRGFRARINRHFKKDKKTFWHIDYLLKKAPIVRALVKPASFNECRMTRVLCRILDNSYLPLPGFGASDCRCPGHLVYMAGKQDLKNIILTLKSELRMCDFTSWQQSRSRSKRV